MARKGTVTIELTKGQQLEVLATTGLLFRSLEVDPGEVDADAGIAARLPLPRWLTAAASEPEHANGGTR